MDENLVHEAGNGIESLVINIKLMRRGTPSKQGKCRGPGMSQLFKSTNQKLGFQSQDVK